MRRRTVSPQIVQRSRPFSSMLSNWRTTRSTTTVFPRIEVSDERRRFIIGGTIMRDLGMALKHAGELPLGRGDPRC